MPSTASLRAERSIEFLVRTDPNPHPIVSFESAGDSTIISSHTNRPCSRRVPYSFKAETRVRWILQEAAVGGLCRPSDRGRKSPIHLPKRGRSARSHDFSSKSLSRTTGNCSGSFRYCASISSRNFSSLGHGVGSLMIRLHSASPSNSGSKAGIDSTSCARSAAERFLIAFAISSTVLTNKFYDKEPDFTRPRPVR